MKFFGETSIKKLISLIKAELKTKVSKEGGDTISTNDIGLTVANNSGETESIGIGYGRIDFNAPNTPASGVSVYVDTSESNENPTLSFYGSDGDELTILNNLADPISNIQAATKRYVDNAVSQAGMPHPIILDSTTDYGNTLPTNPKTGQLFFQKATSGLAIANGGTGATTASQALTNLGGLPLTGGVMVDSGPQRGMIQFPGISSGWGTARDRCAIRVLQGGAYTPALSLKSTDCTWDIATYNNNLEITKFLDSVYEAGSNTPEKEYTFRNDGIVGLQSTKLLANGSISSSTSLYGNVGDTKLYKNIYVLLGEMLGGNNQYYSFICPCEGKADHWYIYLPSSNDYYRAKVDLDAQGGVRVSIISTGITRQCYIYASL